TVELVVHRRGVRALQPAREERVCPRERFAAADTASAGGEPAQALPPRAFPVLASGRGERLQVLVRAAEHRGAQRVSEPEVGEGRDEEFEQRDDILRLEGIE